jgi:hypothetical protein
MTSTKTITTNKGNPMAGRKDISSSKQQTQLILASRDRPTAGWHTQERPEKELVNLSRRAATNLNLNVSLEEVDHMIKCVK